jgi:hypothetical protein
LANPRGADGLLLGCATPGRAREAVKRIRSGGRLAVTISTLSELVADPLPPIWTPAGGGERLALPDVAAR